MDPEWFDADPDQTFYIYFFIYIYFFYSHIILLTCMNVTMHHFYGIREHGLDFWCIRIPPPLWVRTCYL